MHACVQADGAVVHASHTIGLTIKSCAFMHNIAQNNGGVVFSVGSTDLHLESSKFTNNSAVTLSSMGMRLFRSIESFNVLQLQGGAMFADNVNTLASVLCDFESNMAVFLCRPWCMCHTCFVRSLVAVMFL